MLRRLLIANPKPIDKESAALVGKEYCEFAKWSVGTGGVVLGIFAANLKSSGSIHTANASIVVAILYFLMVLMAVTTLVSMPQLLMAENDKGRGKEVAEMRKPLFGVVLLFTTIILIILLTFASPQPQPHDNAAPASVAKALPSNAIRHQ